MPADLANEPGTPTLDSFRTSDGYRCHYRFFKAEAPKGTLVFIHGIQSHGGWYPRSCSEIAAMGYDVYFLDRRGSGLNAEQRGDAPSFRRLLDDVKEFIDHVPKRGGKTFLAAISWGGKLGAAFNYRHPDKIDGLILLCPGLYPQVRPAFFQRMAIGWSKLFRPLRLFPVPLSDPKLFTASEKWQKFLAEDKLATHKATARFLFESNSLDIYLRRAKKAITLPLLLLLGGQEKVIRNDPTVKWYDRLKGADKMLIEYPQAYHTLEFEENCRFVTDIVEWMDERSS